MQGGEQQANLAPTCPVIATMGMLSSSASASPVTRLVAPGPDVAMHTPTSPVVLAYPSAAKISPCTAVGTVSCAQLQGSERQSQKLPHDCQELSHARL